MPRLPKMPIKGEPIPAEWGIDVVTFLRSLVVGGDSKRIHTSWSSGGQSISWQPPEPKLEDYFGYWKSENEFGVSSDTFVIRAGRVFGYYGTVDIVETEVVITAVTDFWVTVTMPHDDATFAAVLNNGTYPGLRSGGPPEDEINILIGQILEPTTGNFQWTQKWKGSIFIPTLFWPGEHAEFINLSQDVQHLLKLEYVATDFDLKVTSERTRHLKGLLSQIVSTSTLHIDLSPGDDSVTGEMLDPDIAGDGLTQDVNGNLDLNFDSSQFEIVGDKLTFKADGILGIHLNPAIAGLGLVQDVNGNLDVNVDSTEFSDVTNVKYSNVTAKLEQTKQGIKIVIIGDALRIVGSTGVDSTVFTGVDCPTTT